MFATRIAVRRANVSEIVGLHHRGCRGFNSQAALRSREPIISPAWSSWAHALLTSFESASGGVCAFSRDGGTAAVANFRGSNSAPAWSPDGRSLAVTLTREGTHMFFDERGRF